MYKLCSLFGPKTTKLSYVNILNDGCDDYFVLLGRDIHNANLLRKVHKSWDNVARKMREIGPRSCGVGKKYHDWVKNKAREMKLPFHHNISFLNNEDL